MRKLIKKNQQLLLVMAIVLGFGVMLCDAVFYAGFFKKHFFLDDKLFIFVITAVLVMGKLVWHIKLDATLSRINFYFVLPLFLLILVIGIFGEYFIYTNFLYGYLHLDVYQFIYVVGFSWLLAVIYPLSNQWHYPVLVFGAGLLVTLAGLMHRIRGPWYFRLLMGATGQDDSWTENIQFILYLISAFLTGLTAQSFRQNRKSWLLVAAYVVITIGLFFVAGEEISWGQRILNIKTPDQIVATNTQGEINVHNNQVVFGYVYRAYVCLTAYCSFAWILNLFKKVLLPRLQDRLNWWRYFIPPVYLISFFLTSFILFYLYRIRNIPLGEWEEYSELMLALGLVLFFGRNFIQEKNIKTSDWA